MHELDRQWMAEAIAEAESVLGSTWPNPAVGAVLVKDGHCLARGATQAAGQNHAEVECLLKAGDAARGACLYVTLEPCCHHGRTPPCTDAIIRAGVRRVVYALIDPNPLVAGKGASILAGAGVEVCGGVLAEEARGIMREYCRFMHTGRPYITIKYAMTLDGRLALDNGDSYWISGEEARSSVQLLRKHTQAILTGGQTIRHDDPRLDCRIADAAGPVWQPLRVIVTERGFSPDARLFGQGGPVLLITSDEAAKSLDPELLEKTEVITLPALEASAIIEALAARNIISLLVEAGPKLITEFIAARLCDQVIAFVAPALAGGTTLQSLGEIGTGRMQNALRLRGEWKNFGSDICFQGEPIWGEGR
jgi:diaminohydroxyphosphoribosylaminopyrimidine deaminase/5-amino-6-(5-phosphoribosylamino)uracil reductase